MLKRVTMVLVLGLMTQIALAANEHGAAPTHEGGGAAAQPDSHGGGHATPPLLPDLKDKSTYLEALWVVIIFVVLLAVLYPTAWRNVLAGLKKREQRIRDDIASAEAARKRAEDTLREYNTKLAQAEDRIRNMLAQATTEGEKLATSIRMKAQQEAEEVKERANRDIEGARDAALREIYEKTAELATSVAEKIIRKNLNPADQQELVRQSLEQLQSAK